MLKAYRALPPRTRLAVGVSLLAWGSIGLYASDGAGAKLGFTATAPDREALEAVMPRVVSVERPEGRPRG
ncbi:hypothetical protein BJ875DRAFT_430977 [Amylocarpus encephaloides]|uniref:Uncharacterized protein n=1 Tax=Amylocarpus encephaloides TaxID=45428 RepID=A0A9P8C1T7_9HELO|nr:hypothetical protein BJ875DRAFT_430977 [Amylocarpus encephaloides]